MFFIIFISIKMGEKRRGRFLGRSVYAHPRVVSYHGVCGSLGRLGGLPRDLGVHPPAAGATSGSTCKGAVNEAIELQTSGESYLTSCWTGLSMAEVLDAYMPLEGRGQCTDCSARAIASMRLVSVFPSM